MKYKSERYGGRGIGTEEFEVRGSLKEILESELNGYGRRRRQHSDTAKEFDVLVYETVLQVQR